MNTKKGTKKESTTKTKNSCRYSTQEVSSKLEAYYANNKRKQRWISDVKDNGQKFYMQSNNILTNKLVSISYIKKRKHHGPWIWVDRYIADKSKKLETYLGGTWMPEDNFSKVLQNKATDVCFL